MEQKDTYGKEIELEQKRRKAKVKYKHRKEAESLGRAVSFLIRRARRNG